jgi:signal transduction histidine kinase
VASRLSFGPPRLPLESTAPVAGFALLRLGVTLSAIVAVAILGFPFQGRLEAVLAAVALPWAALVLVVSRRRPEAALHPLVAVGDIASLAAVEAVVHESYGAVRFVALFLIGAHAHFQGERRGIAIAAGGAGLLIAGGLVFGSDLPHGTRDVYEALFAVSALATAATIGGLRTAESAGRLRARQLTRRAMSAEDELRRRLAMSIHDGPVQELVSLEMILTAARQASERGEVERARELLEDARGLAARNVSVLRDQIVSLAPHAFEELSFATAVEESVPIWRRRFGVQVTTSIEEVALEPEVEGALVRIVQEAVANAARHAAARSIAVRLVSGPDTAVLEIADDGHGFERVERLRVNEPGHLGLATMRERAESVGGRLEIETGPAGTTVRAAVPRRR